MLSWIWRNFRMDHPPEWELLQYSHNPEAGRCAFADRYQFRLEFNWRRVDAPPDFDRTLSAYKDKLSHDNTKVAVEQVRHGSWCGLETKDGTVITSRFGRYFDHSSCLIEIVFIWPQAKNEVLKRQILNSVHEEPVRDGLQRWQTFGMDIRASKNLPLQACRVEPARAKITFGTDKQAPNSESFERLGLVEQWLDAPLADWLNNRPPRSVYNTSRETINHSDHRIELLEGKIAAGRLSRMIGRRHWYQAAAWICPFDGRIYCVTRTCPQCEAIAPETLASGRLTCCNALRDRR